MQDNCLHQNFHWVEDAHCYECDLCLRPIEAASNVCSLCHEAIDSHKLNPSGPTSLISDRARRLHAIS